MGQISDRRKHQPRGKKAILCLKCEKNVETAMSKTVGLPLGIAAKLILTNKINLTGVHLPITKEIYEPILAELAKKKSN
ncbi:MAG: hypothetical protein EAZ27_09495 [Cytophagales bacterium]|nr:MAG: hypothetical protein EAZ27_09495 [Cytophagales bacterium]